jgi:Flp pilus assembly protein TadB
MKKYDRTMVSIWIIWAWVILAAIAVGWDNWSWEVAAVLIIVIGGALSCLMVTRMDAESHITKTESMPQEGEQ